MPPIWRREPARLKRILLQYELMSKSIIAEIGEIGEIIKRTRLASGLTQQEVAASAKVSRTLVSSIEKGKHDPKVGTLIKIGRVLGLSCIVRKGKYDSTKH